jgi:hypothetical protein
LSEAPEAGGSTVIKSTRCGEPYEQWCDMAAASAGWRFNAARRGCTVERAMSGSPIATRTVWFND